MPNRKPYFYELFSALDRIEVMENAVVESAVICESELTAETLYDKINELASDKKALDNMSCEVKKLAEPHALEKLYGVIKGLTEK